MEEMSAEFNPQPSSSSPIQPNELEQQQQLHQQLYQQYYQQHQQHQQQQQQQPTLSMVDQNQPRHEQTTPGWNNQDVDMMEGVVEDGTNESSPLSERNTPSVEDHLSIKNSPCSMKDNYSNNGSPMEYMNCEPGSSKSVKIAQKQTKNTKTKRTKSQKCFKYECPLCPYIATADRDVFDEHLKIHYNPNRLPGEPPVPEEIDSPTLTGEKMKIHIQKHEKAINYPVINTQGKVKLNICKICHNYVGITKVEYWRHYKIHVDLDKRLSCPYCPFISNLKHHYEYHMNKQLGIKPFKCEECTYECVNKSMLSSHRKSHTDLRQFSCQSCSYVTKYCHSLKIHLRRNNHLPGPVLNPDGTVNHLSTVDVYGKRRGPKQKKQTSGESSNQVSHPIVNGQNQPSTSQISVPLPPPPPPAPSSTPSNPSTSHASTSNDYQQANMMNQMFNSLPTPNPFSGAGLNSMLAMKYNSLLRNGFPTAEPYMINEQLRTNVLAGFMAAANQLQQNEFQQEIMNYYYASSRINQSAAAAAAARDQCQEFLDQNVQSLQVLDLSRNNTSDEVEDSNINNENNRSNANNNNIATLKNNNISNEEEEHDEERQVQERTNSDQSLNGSVAAASTPRTAGTSRRKGRAVKLNRRVVENDDSIAENEAESPMTERGTPESYGSTMDGRSPIDENDATHHRGNPFECTYCQIIFGNEVMYTVHMGYHGYKNPYTCNMCGQVNNDAISFNVHLSRARHS